jgi:pyridinium-3,5-bisthiocarboxylic acid mononucleotide nickel chelatase
MALAHIHLDPLGGIAGDMFLAALLDAFPEHAEATFAAMRAAGLPHDWQVGLVAHGDGVLTGSRVVIEGPAGACEPGHGPGPGSFRAIRARLREAALPRPLAERATLIFAELAGAEAKVHGIEIDEVHFHELADWDSIADVVGAAALIEALGAPSFSSAPVPQGSGRVMTAHGALPVPAPATALLLEGMPVFDDGIPGERVTPTGAALLRHLAVGPRLPSGPWCLCGTGIGFGAQRLPGLSNALRALAYQPAASGRADDRVAVIAFEVDDQSAEELALGLDALRALDGVLDVVQIPAFGKKGRLASQVQVLARPERLDATIARCFAETTTIGLRWRIEARALLAREEVTVDTPHGMLAVKRVTRPDGARTAKAEIEPLRGAAGGHAARAGRRRAAEAHALGRERDDRQG